MYIAHLSILNFKRFETLELDLNPGMSIIVGDNSTGKSTILEAIHLLLSGTYDGKVLTSPIPPHIFNINATKHFFDSIRKRADTPPPSIRIEALIANTIEGEVSYLLEITPEPSYISLVIEAAKEETRDSLPTEYYRIRRSKFVNGKPTLKSAPFFRSHMLSYDLTEKIDIQETIDTLLQSGLSDDDMSRISKLQSELTNIALGDDTISELNAAMSKRTRKLYTGEELHVNTDFTESSQWTSMLSLSVDGLPLNACGQGTIKAILTNAALTSLTSDRRIAAGPILIEEPENRLSYQSLQRFLAHLSSLNTERQIILTTLSSNVVNHFGLNNLILLSHKGCSTLRSLPPDTRDFFERLSGYDTLRLILAPKVILTEGDSDELIIQKAYLELHRHLPIVDGIDTITVHGLAFTRYLELAHGLNTDIAIVTDNDGNPDGVRCRLNSSNDNHISIFTPDTLLSYSDFEGDAIPGFNYNTLEPHMLKANRLDTLNKVFHTEFTNDREMLQYMHRNKCECALQLFRTEIQLKYPQYIIDAIEKFS